MVILRDQILFLTVGLAALLLWTQIVFSGPFLTYCIRARQELHAERFDSETARRNLQRIPELVEQTRKWKKYVQVIVFLGFGLMCLLEYLKR